MELKVPYPNPYNYIVHVHIVDSPEDLGVQFIEMFIKKQSNIELILSTLEVLI